LFAPAAKSWLIEAVPNIRLKTVFTTKGTKLRGLKISMSETFVAFVYFVVETLFAIFPTAKPD
jgi:hypothetical protein